MPEQLESSGFSLSPREDDDKDGVEPAGDDAELDDEDDEDDDDLEDDEDDEDDDDFDEEFEDELIDLDDEYDKHGEPDDDTHRRDPDARSTRVRASSFGQGPRCR